MVIRLFSFRLFKVEKPKALSLRSADVVWM